MKKQTLSLILTGILFAPTVAQAAQQTMGNKPSAKVIKSCLDRVIPILNIDMASEKYTQSQLDALSDQYEVACRTNGEQSEQFDQRIRGFRATEIASAFQESCEQLKATHQTSGLPEGLPPLCEDMAQFQERLNRSAVGREISFAPEKSPNKDGQEDSASMTYQAAQQDLCSQMVDLYQFTQHELYSDGQIIQLGSLKAQSEGHPPSWRDRCKLSPATTMENLLRTMGFMPQPIKVQTTGGDKDSRKDISYAPHLPTTDTYHNLAGQTLSLGGQAN